MQVGSRNVGVQQICSCVVDIQVCTQQICTYVVGVQQIFRCVVEMQVCSRYLGVQQIFRCVPSRYVGMYVCSRCVVDLQQVSSRYVGMQQVTVSRQRCDQIGQFIILWIIFQSPGQKLFCPNRQHILGNLCKGVEIFHFIREILFGQLLQTFGDFLLVTLVNSRYVVNVCSKYAEGIQQVCKRWRWVE